MTLPIRPLFLIGPRACGKTSVGRRLAQALQWTFIDTDAALQERLGRSIAEITATEGWSYFRDEESHTLTSVTALRTVIATGGGIVLRSANCAFMRAHGQVFYLYAPASVLVARLIRHPRSSQRPSLTGNPIYSEVQDILRQRAPLYENCARHIVDATLPMSSLLHLILHNL